MAKKGTKRCPIFSMFMLLFLIFNLPMLHGEELELLLSFKASIKDQFGFLSDWNSSATFCNWHGIVCDNSSHVNSLELSGQNISGKLSASIFQLQYVKVVDLSNNQLFGEIPGQMKSLKWIYLGYNNLSGEIPTEIGDLTSLNHLDVVYNNLRGHIPFSLGNLSNLQYLFLYENKLTGPIPRSLFNLKKLASLDLSINSLFGEIPELIIQLQNLEILHLFSNNFTGKIPAALTSLPRLQVLQLWSNQLSGEIPRDLGRLNNLTVLDLSTNYLSGKIPESLCNSGQLYKLILFSNSLEGEIPTSLSSCKSLKRVRLQNNRLSGELSSGFTKLPLVNFLDISNNYLSGRIDKQKWDMASLEMLNLGKNNFFGELPGSFGSDKLQNLDLSENQFSGNIPKSFGGLSELVQLELRENKLSVLLPAIITFVVAILQVVYRNARAGNELEQKRVENENGIWEMQFFDSKVSKSLTMEDIFSSAKDENVIMRGNKNGVSVSYRGKSLMNNMQFVVKEMKGENTVLPTSFWSVVAEFGKLKHPNIIRLMGICWSEKSGFLVYEYVEGKVLSEVLRNLSWERRRKIAIGIAKALSFLHGYCSPSVVVGDMSPERVLVDGKDEPRLSLSLPAGLACTDIQFSSAYVAPETRETKEMTEQSDIYGFGLILIELLTGKSPTDTEFGMQENNIVEWARYCYSDCHLDVWIDSMIRGHATNNQNEIVETMNLALHCTATDPTARPCATQVLKNLESAMKPSSCVSNLKFSSSN
ncbi:putativeinactive leucine-rich repeat receptor-like protein kinase [Quercus suber]|uniref:Putativeinactive leucine-rich repeat receptor-like protein kinase n=1 Tax=Quercus suber TaxID=58331 RepID=A0AAW0L3U8_QUESU